MAFEEISEKQWKLNKQLIVDTNLGQVGEVDSLLDAGADVNFRDKEDCTPLHLASRRNHLKVVKLLIDNGANVNLKDKLGFTPLHWACVRRHLLVAEELIESSARVEKVDISGATPLQWAARKGHLALVEFLILKAGATLHHKDKSGMTALKWAIKKGNQDVARFIEGLHDTSTSAVTKKATQNELSKLDAPPPTVIARFANHGTKVSDIERFFSGLKISYIKVLRNKCAEVTFQSSDDHFEALTMTDLKMTRKCRVAVFPAKYVRAPSKSKSQDRSHTYPSVSKHIQLSKGKQSIDFFQKRLKQGQEIQVRDSDGATPLHWASHRNNLKLVQLLIDNGAKINVKTNSQATALHFAATSDSPQVIEYLAQKKAKLEEKDDRGETPLFLASKLNLIENVKVLLQNGANVEATNIRMQTPLHAAARNGHVNVVKILLEYNAKVPPQDMSEFNAKCRLPEIYQGETKVQLLADFLVKKYLHMKALVENQKQTFFGVGRAGNGKFSKSLAPEIEEAFWRKFDLRESKKTRMYEVVKMKAKSCFK